MQKDEFQILRYTKSESLDLEATDSVVQVINFNIDDSATEFILHHDVTPFSIFAYSAGLFVFIFVFFSFAIQPFARHSFIMRAIKRLYFARSKTHDIF